jgi:hypothetical protein
VSLQWKLWRASLASGKAKANRVQEPAATSCGAPSAGSPSPAALRRCHNSGGKLDVRVKVSRARFSVLSAGSAARHGESPDPGGRAIGLPDLAWSGIRRGMTKESRGTALDRGGTPGSPSPTFPRDRNRPTRAARISPVTRFVGREITGRPRQSDAHPAKERTHRSSGHSIPVTEEPLRPGSEHSLQPYGVTGGPRACGCQGDHRTAPAAGAGPQEPGSFLQAPVPDLDRDSGRRPRPVCRSVTSAE